MSLARKLPLILLLLMVLGAALGLFLVWPHLEGSAPEIVLATPPSHIGRLTTLDITVRDQGTGLAYLRVTASQGSKEIKLLDKDYAGGSSWSLHGLAEANEKVEIKALEIGLTQGPATLTVEARDRSFRSWLHGNQTLRQYQVIVDTVPPRVSVLSRTIHLNRGGVGLAVYKVSEDTPVHGVQVGGRFFQGVAPWPQDPLARMAYFAFGDDADKNAPVKVLVKDAAGNQGAGALNVRLKWKEFRNDTINVSDRFLEALAPRFMAEAPPDKQDPLSVFVWVNEGLRLKNHETILAACAQSGPMQLWQGTFDRPMGKPMASFGDRRTYMYQGKQVSHSTHLGVDLADVALSPIKSAAAGKVLFAGPLGIYGNCVILDHGQGICSLYGHMSELGVKVGEAVAKDQTLGRSGATGLALGDHLHFSVLVGGVFVNPNEWWDPHWIQDNVDLRFEEAGLPKPLAAK